MLLGWPVVLFGVCFGVGTATRIPDHVDLINYQDVELDRVFGDGKYHLEGHCIHFLENVFLSLKGIYRVFIKYCVSRRY